MEKRKLPEGYQGTLKNQESVEGGNGVAVMGCLVRQREMDARGGDTARNSRGGCAIKPGSINVW